MKKLLIAITLIVTVFLAGTVWAKEKGNFDPYVGFYFGSVDFEFKDCSPECGIDNIPRTTLAGIKAGVFYTGLRSKIRIDPGVEIDYQQTTALHSHEVGAIDDRLPSVVLMVRLPVGISNKFPNGKFQPYVGAGIGSQFSRINMREELGEGDCNHTARIYIVGVKRFLTENLAVFLEHKNSQVKHDSFIETRPDIRVNQVMRSNVIGLAYHF